MLAANPLQIAIWSVIETGLSITAGSLVVARNDVSIGNSPGAAKKP